MITIYVELRLKSGFVSFDFVSQSKEAFADCAMVSLGKNLQLHVE